MSFNSDSRQQIALKKLAGKAHTKNEAEFFNESKSSGVTSSAERIFAENVTRSPLDSALYDSDNIYELVRLKAVPAPESLQSRHYHGFVLQLPDDYESSISINKNKGTEPFVNAKPLVETLGKIQLIPPSFGLSYEAKLYYGQETDTQIGSGTRIPPNDPRNWYIDYYNGVIFQQDPPQHLDPNDSGDHPQNPLWVDAYIYIGKMISEANYSSVSSLWEYDLENNLQPTNILDGDTGCWALDMNLNLLNDGEVSLVTYTTTTREDAIDKYFELDDDGNVTTKDDE
jgi:hypothetical protein